MNKETKSIAQRLASAQVAINNAMTSTEVGLYLSRYGYGPAKLQEGKTLLDAAVAAYQLQLSVAGGRNAATATVTTAYNDTRLAYQGLAQVCRAVFGPTNPMLATLGLNRPTPARQADLLARANALFDNAIGNASMATSLGQFGYTSQKLNSEKAKVTSFAAAIQQREAAKGTAQQATVDRDKALEALDRWMSAFRRVAKVALREHPQLLEELSIVTLYGKTPAQQQAPAKATRTKEARKAAALHTVPVPPSQPEKATA